MRLTETLTVDFCKKGTKMAQKHHTQLKFLREYLKNHIGALLTQKDYETR